MSWWQRSSLRNHILDLSHMEWLKTLFRLRTSPQHLSYLLHQLGFYNDMVADWNVFNRSIFLKALKSSKTKVSWKILSKFVKWNHFPSLCLISLNSYSFRWIQKATMTILIGLALETPYVCCWKFVVVCIIQMKRFFIANLVIFVNLIPFEKKSILSSLNGNNYIKRFHLDFCFKQFSKLCGNFNWIFFRRSRRYKNLKIPLLCHMGGTAPY